MSKPKRNCPKCGHPLIEHRKPSRPFSQKYYECRHEGCRIETPYYIGRCHITGADFAQK